MIEIIAEILMIISALCMTGTIAMTVNIIENILEVNE